MLNFNKMRYYSERSNEISRRLIDNFLIYLCMEEEDLGNKFLRRLEDYVDILNEMPEEWPRYSAVQYIAFKLFHQGGLASKYLDHIKVRRRSDKELDYLRFQIKHPWRFVFCSIEQHPRNDFFEIKDVLSGERFWLFSEGIEKIEHTLGAMSLYFLLIGFNGECWQTYGNLAYLKGIQPFDLVFFAQQLKQGQVSVQEIPEMIAADPVPFMMLWHRGRIPMVYHKQELIVSVSAEYKLDQFNIKSMEKDFMVEEKPPVYKFSLKDWQKMPHFCSCFYHTEKKILSVKAGTERGYQKIVEVLDNLGYCPPTEPDYRVTPLMHSMAEQILKRKIELSPYEKLFTIESSPEEEEEIAKINNFLKRLVDALNSDEDYNLQELAFRAGIEVETAKDLEKMVLEKMRAR